MADEFENARPPRCLPVTLWPAADRAAWEAAHCRTGLLDEDGLAADWGAATSSIIAGGYGRFLSFLAGIGELDPTTHPPDRVTRPHVEAYVSHLRELNQSSTVLGRILQLARAVAVMAPEVDWAWLRRIAARLRRMATPARDDRARLLPAATLQELGVALMRRAESDHHLSIRRGALPFRDGLMISLLCACPLRARNLADMAIGTSLQRRGSDWWIAFGPGETKNRRSVEMPLPATLTGPIQRYLGHYRPLLLARSSTPRNTDAFWISDGGQPLTAKEVGQLVSRRTKLELGRDLNPHLFRKLVPTELAIRDPEHVGIAQAMLGHADYRTTQQAYNLGRALDAAHRSQAVIHSIRRQSRPDSR
jgi:integrase/recombinase XerD